MRLSLGERIRLAYSQLNLWFGLFLVIVSAGTLTQADWDSLYFWLGPVTTVPGHIVSTYPTEYRVDDYAVRGFTYRYPAAGLEWAGTSFSRDSTLQPGQAARVEYSAGHPAVSRLQGTNSAPLGSAGLLVGLCFAGAGLGMSLRSTWRTRRLLAIVDDAATTEAIYQRTSSPTVDSDDKQYVLHYTYQAAYQRYTLRVEAPQAVPRRKREVVVFQGAVPANAVLLTSLPTFIQRKVVVSRHE